MVVWCPDWPVVAAAAQLGCGPAAAARGGRARARSTPARRRPGSEGVRRGMRRRDAAARCPELIVLDRRRRARDPDLRGRAVRGRGDRRRGDPDPARAVCPRGGQPVLRRGAAGGRGGGRAPGRRRAVGLPDRHRRRHLRRRAGGPAGGPAGLLRDRARGTRPRSWPGCRSRCWTIPTWPSCCAGWASAAWATSPPWRRGTCSPASASRGAGLHRLARGEDARPAVSRRPPLELDQRVVFEPGLETIEPIVFSTRQTADRLVAELARHGLVCTQVRIEVVDRRRLDRVPGLGALALVHRRRT